MNKTVLIILVLVVVALGAGTFLLRDSGQEAREATPAETMADMAPSVSESDAMSDAELSEYVDISAEAAYELVQSGDSDLVVLDVSPRFAEGRLPGAVNHYVGDGSLDRAIPGLDTEKTYLVYCHVDSAAIAGAEKLVEAGFPYVLRLLGNYGGWKTAGYPIEVGLEAIDPYTGSGVATRGFRDGEFVHTVTADIEDPAAGKFYEGWLVRGSSFFSTGRMERDGESYTLRYVSPEDARDYVRVVITEETESLGLDGNPEAHVIEGSFE